MVQGTPQGRRKLTRFETERSLYTWALQIVYVCLQTCRIYPFTQSPKILAMVSWQPQPLFPRPFCMEENWKRFPKVPRRSELPPSTMTALNELVSLEENSLPGISAAKKRLRAQNNQARMLMHTHIYSTCMRVSIHKTPTQLNLNSSGPTRVPGFQRIVCTKQQPAHQEPHLQCMTTCFKVNFCQ
jgi:hypothetical protein